VTRCARWIAIAVLAGVVLAACAPLPVRKPGTVRQLAAQTARERMVAAEPDWSLEGRFAASDGRQGGSGGLEWRQTGDRYRFILRAPITGKSVQLDGGPDGAVLTGAGKLPVAGANARMVLNEEFGWDVPVTDLAWWVRGLRAPGKPAILTFGVDGLPATLDQDGWHIDYRGWYAEHAPPLPQKVYASRDPYKVRVMIETWRFGDAAARGMSAKP
jgi:outer membrane lipoprotein LolB